MSGLFESPVLRVDQPRGAPAARSQYQVYDGHGTLVATAAEHGISPLRQAARTAIGGMGSDRTVHVESADGTPLLVLEKKHEHTRVSAPNGVLFGTMKNDRLYKYVILDAAERPVGELDGSRFGRKFPVLDGYGNHVAQVDKKWKGAATEILTTADRYSVEIFQPLADPLRILVAAAPIAIDLMLYETKDWPVG